MFLFRGFRKARKRAWGPTPLYTISTRKVNVFVQDKRRRVRRQLRPVLSKRYWTTTLFGYMRVYCVYGVLYYVPDAVYPVFSFSRQSNIIIIFLCTALCVRIRACCRVSKTRRTYIYVSSSSKLRGFFIHGLRGFFVMRILYNMRVRIKLNFHEFYNIIKMQNWSVATIAHLCNILIQYYNIII